MSPNGRGKGAVARIVGLYVSFSALWILLSDRAVNVLVTGEAAREVANTVKGWCFVAVTGTTLYVLLSRLARRLATGEQRAVTEAAGRMELAARIEQIAAAWPSVLYAVRLRLDGVMEMPYAAPGMADLFGLDVPAVADDVAPVFARMHPDDFRVVRKLALESAREMAPWQVDFRYDHPVRGMRWIEGRSLPVRLADGSTLWNGTFTDVSDHKQIEQALIDADDLLRDALAASDMAVWEWDADTAQMYLSPEFDAVAGMAAPFTGIEAMWDRVPVEDRAAMRAVIREVMAGGTMVPQEIRFRRDDGTTMWLQMLARRRPSATGRAVLVGTVQDITDRKRTAEALDVLERRAVLALEAAGHGVWDYDGRTHRTFFSPQWKAMLGYAEHEITDDPLEWDRRVHPDDLGSTLHALDEHIAGRRPLYRHEQRMLRRDGSYLWVLDQGEVLERDDDGRPLRLLGTFTDISWKHELDERLRESEQRYRSIVSSLSEGLVLVDAEGDVQTINRSARRMLGIEEGVPATRLPLTFDTEAVDRDGLHLAAVDHPIWRTLRTAEPCRDVVVGVAGSDGRQRWIAINAEPIGRDDAGAPFAVVASLNDITERLQAEHELQEHRTHLERLVTERTRQLELAYEVLTGSAAEVADLYDNAPCGYHSLDATGTFVAMNATELSWLGYERDEIIGRKKISEVVAPESWPALEQGFTRLLTGEAVNGVELVFLRRDGSRLPVVASATAIVDEQGGFVASRSTVFDDTVRTERDRQIARLNAELERRADDAEAANRAKSVFLATMSHEIRTPLNAIVGLTHLVRTERFDVARDALVDKLFAASQHLTAVISDVLDLSRIEADRVQLERADLRLADVLADARGLVTDRALAKGLAVDIDLDPRLPQVVRGDPTRLRQLVLNYLTNAVKFTERGRVLVRCLAGEVDADAVTIRVEVSDTGPGISQAEQALLFVPFEQLDASTTRRHGGSGLGLAINRRLASLMDGEVGVVSAEGEGSTFWFTAVLHRSDAPAPSALAGGAPLRAVEQVPLYGHVLVAEDDPLSQEVAVSLLRGMGLTVDAVGDGVSAVRKAAATQYDLVLMDVHMPLMDGITATRIMRGLPGMIDVPIVAMTANAFREDRAACLAAGATDHVAKPVEPSVLRATLACWLSDEQHHLDLVDDTELSASLRVPGLRPGLSPERGLRYTSGDARSYLRWLHRFASTNGAAVAELRPGATDITGDRAALLALAHRLKGSAGLIGAVEVEERATELNDVLRAGPTDAPVLDMARALGEALGRVVASISTLPTVDDDDGDDGRGGDLLVHELEELLAAADVLATDLWVRRRAQLGTALGERSMAVGAAIERYDYDEALRLLRATAAR